MICIGMDGGYVAEVNACLSETGVLGLSSGFR